MTSYIPQQTQWWAGPLSHSPQAGSMWSRLPGLFQQAHLGPSLSLASSPGHVSSSSCSVRTSWPGSQCRCSGSQCRCSQPDQGEFLPLEPLPSGFCQLFLRRGGGKRREEEREEEEGRGEEEGRREEGIM